MIEGILIAAGSVALGQWIAKWRNTPRSRQPQWPMTVGLFLGRSVARLIRRKNGWQRGGNRRRSPQQVGHIAHS